MAAKRQRRRAEPEPAERQNAGRGAAPAPACAERACVESATLIDSLRDVVLVFDAETYRLLEVNSAACRLSGYDRDELLGMSVADLRLPAQRAAVAATVAEALATGGTELPYRVDWQTKDGRTVPIEFVNRAISYGGRAAIVACGREIGDRLAWEASIREAEARFADVLDNAPLAIYLKDTDRRYTHVNHEYARMIGRAPEEIIGRTVEDLLPPRLARLFTAHDRAVLTSGRPSTLESAPTLADSKRSVVTAKFPLRDADGTIKGIGSITSDVTQLRQAQEQLEEFFTLASDIYVVFGPDGRFERFNPALERTLGYDAFELRAMSRLELIHPDDLEIVKGSGERFDAREQGFHLEVRYRHKRGHYVWLDWTGAPRSADGRRYAAARDVTERRRLQAEAEAHALQQAALSNLSRLALADLTVEDLLAQATAIVAEALAADLVAVVQTGAGDALRVSAAAGRHEDLIGTTVPQLSLAGLAIDRQAAVIVPDFTSETRFALPPAKAALGIVSGIATPLRLSDGLFGAIEVFTCTPHAFSLEEATFLASIAGVLSTALERDRSARALRESEERYRRIFEDASEGIFQTDASNRFVVANTAVARILGYSSGEELIGEIDDIRTQVAADPARFDELRMLLKTIGAARSFDMQVRRRDGTLADVRLNARLTIEPDGARTVSAVVADVTVERAATQALRESEERYRRIFEDSSDGIYQTDGLQRFALMNRATARILGYDTPDEAIAAITDIKDIYVDPVQRDALMQALVRERSVQNWEIQVRRRDGSIALLSVSARLVDDGRGGTCISGISKDVTAEREARDALQRSEEQYRRIVESTSEGIWTADARGVTTFVNRRMAELLGYSQEEMIGRSVESFTDETGREEFRQAMARQAQGDGAEQLFRLVHRDGRQVWVEVSATPLFENGVFVGSLALMRDMTELREAQQYKHRALHDPLTGLANRTLFGEHLDQALRTATRRGEPLAVLQIDLDGFKQVNDTLGHHAGDLLLQAIADRLRLTLRESDSVARLGGDEFSVLLPSTDAARAEYVAEKLVEAVTAPVSVGEAVARVGMSVGVAAFPANGHSAALLLRRADAAMYAAKRRCSGVAVWSAALDAAPARAS